MLMPPIGKGQVLLPISHLSRVLCLIQTLQFSYNNIYNLLLLFTIVRYRDYMVLLSEPNEREASDGRLRMS